MSKFVKQMMLDALDRIKLTNDNFIVIDISKVPAMTVNRVRLDLAEKDVRVFTIKNAIAAKVFANYGFISSARHFSGSSSIVFGAADPVALAKHIVGLSESVKSLAIRGGIVQGEFLSVAEVDALSKSPSRIDILAQVSGIITSPASSLINAISSSSVLIASQVNTKSK